MACSSSIVGITLDCSSSKGGIKRAWVSPYVDGAWEFTTDPNTNGRAAVSGMSESLSFHAYEFKKNTGSFTSTLNSDAAAGYSYWSTEIILQFTKLETEKRIAISALAVADAVVVVEDANGKMWCFGADSPVNASAGSGQTGTNATDGNYMQITLADEQNEFPCAMTDAFKKTFLETIEA